MSRRAFFPGLSTSLTPTGDAPSSHEAVGEETPRIPSAIPERATGATGRDVGQVLARVAGLHEQLGQAFLELQNCLADARDSRDMTCVETTTTRPRLLSIQDIAERLQIDARTVRRMRARGQLPPAIDLYSVLRWDEPTIEAWIEGRRER